MNMIDESNVPKDVIVETEVLLNSVRHLDNTLAVNVITSAFATMVLNLKGEMQQKIAKGVIEVLQGVLEEHHINPKDIH